ncbi:MAG: GNAT family N-acetyltransferase [Actinomycetota bacterium]|nr:GNAT family N-acetyltransferase [Actinomycetota bacterium]
MEAARRAAEADLAVLVGLWRSATAAAATARGGRAVLAELPSSEQLTEVLRAALDTPDSIVVAGRIDDVVVGVAAARRHRPVSEPDRPVGVVDLLFVEPAARGVGVGEAMMDVVIGWAQEVGCHGIDACALPGARDAKAFFETVGLVTRLLVMHRSITPRPDPAPSPPPLPGADGDRR